MAEVGGTVTVSGNKVRNNSLSEIRKPSEGLDAQLLQDVFSAKDLFAWWLQTKCALEVGDLERHSAP